MFSIIWTRSGRAEAIDIMGERLANFRPGRCRSADCRGGGRAPTAVKAPCADRIPWPPQASTAAISQARRLTARIALPVASGHASMSALPASMAASRLNNPARLAEALPPAASTTSSRISIGMSHGWKVPDSGEIYSERAPSDAGSACSKLFRNARLRSANATHPVSGVSLIAATCH